jgi:hypothetical protein
VCQPAQAGKSSAALPCGMVATGVTMPGGAGVKEFLEVMLKDCGGPT